MLGFELIVNGEARAGAMKDGASSIIATQKSSGQMNTIDMHFGGSEIIDSKQGESVVWYDDFLNEGDEFTVRVKAITKNSVPQENKMYTPEDSLRLYHHLKEELERKGLI